MKPLNIYHQYSIKLTKGKGMELEDDKKNKYLDFYGGHGVISIGHSHPEFIQSITYQLEKLAFYSNAFENPLQNELAEIMGELSGYKSYNLFLSNSGAEANENALKAASFYNNRKKILAVKGAFHGRTTGAISVTDNNTIKPHFGENIEVDFIELNDYKKLIDKLGSQSYSAFIIEGIQGVNGVWEANSEFWKLARLLCTQTKTVLIADEVQSGFGRTGKFFAHQYHNVVADIVTVGKGMGNGFPVAGTLINRSIQLTKGLLGTTFGGGHLACSAVISVLKVLKQDNVMAYTQKIGGILINELEKIKGVKSVRGKGFMIGIEFNTPAKEIRSELLKNYGIITGFSTPDTLRILPPLTITESEIEILINALKAILNAKDKIGYKKELVTELKWKN